MDLISQLLSAAVVLLVAVQQQPNPSPAIIAQTLQTASQAIQYAEYSLLKNASVSTPAPNEDPSPRNNLLYFELRNLTNPLNLVLYQERLLSRS